MDWKLFLKTLPETFLDSSISNDDNRINIAGNLLIKAGHPSNTKKGGVRIYYKYILPLIKKDYITDLKECLVMEITVDNEKCFLCTFIGHPAKFVTNLVISVNNLVYFLTI